MADALKITKGVDAIVHLGGYSVEGPWEAIHQANIVGCYNVFEAARRNSVKRILFATSNHAVGFYRRDQTIDHRVYTKPDGRYGVSKVFGEALGSLYADKYGMEVFLHAHRQRQPEAARQAAPVDLDLAARPRAARVDRHRPPRRQLRDRLRRFRQQAQLVRQLQCRAAGLPAAGRRRDATRRRSWRRRSPAIPSAETYQGGVFVAVEEVPNPAAPQKAAKKRGGKKK